jgi:hypothetical protein
MVDRNSDHGWLLEQLLDLGIEVGAYSSSALGV